MLEVKGNKTGLISWAVFDWQWLSGPSWMKDTQNQWNRKLDQSAVSTMDWGSPISFLVLVFNKRLWKTTVSLGPGENACPELLPNIWLFWGTEIDFFMLSIAPSQPSPPILLEMPENNETKYIGGQLENSGYLYFSSGAAESDPRCRICMGLLSTKV